MTQLRLIHASRREAIFAKWLRVRSRLAEDGPPSSPSSARTHLQKGSSCCYDLNYEVLCGETAAEFRAADSFKFGVAPS